MQRCSLASYQGLLTLALREGWSFARYLDCANISRTLLLRHDVDYSIDLAVEMARVNASLGVRGTFFLLLRSNLYNLLTPRNLRGARALLELGQSIGLHFAALDPVPEDSSDVIAAVQREMDLLRTELPEVESIVAWHNPTAAWLERYANLEIPGLINVYAPAFTRSMCYRSDSNLRNQVEDFESVLRDPAHRALHLLFHPFNWTIGGDTMLEILAGTWRQVIAECEDDFRANRVYQEAMPAGMPSTVLDQFAKAWSVAARRAG